MASPAQLFRCPLSIRLNPLHPVSLRCALFAGMVLGPGWLAAMMATAEGSHLLPTNASYATFALIVAPLLLYAMFGERTYAMQLRVASVLVTGAAPTHLGLQEQCKEKRNLAPSG